MRASLWVGFFLLGSAACFPAHADPVTEADIVKTATHGIVEFQTFFNRLRARAKTDPVLKRVQFDPEKHVALSGGIAREVAWKLALVRGAKPTRLSEVHAADRDLDLLYLGEADADEAHILGVLREEMMESLTTHGANVMRLDVHSLREKEEQTRLAVQGYDTVSQALITPTAILDLALLLGFQRSQEATAALLAPSVIGHLPKGALSGDGDFLHQLVQVVRICKIAAEFPQAVIPESTRANLRIILGAFRERRVALEQFLAAAAERGEHYYRNRLDDVYSAMLRFHGGGDLYKELDAEFELSKFAPLRTLATNAAIVRREVPASITTPPTSADFARLLKPGDRFPMERQFSFDPATRKIFYQNTPVELAFYMQGGVIHGRAISGTTGPVEPELLPIDSWEVLSVRRFKGNWWVVSARNRRKDYQVIGILDVSEGAKAQIQFINGRSFQPESQMGAHAGKRGPMIGMNAVTVDGDALIGFGANRAFQKMVQTQTGGSFRIDRYSASVPVRSRIAALELDHGTLYFLANDGKLFALDANNPALIMENVQGIARGEEGLLAYVEEQPSKSMALYVFSRGATGYRRIPFANSGSAPSPVGIAGNDGATVFYRRPGEARAVPVESPGLQYVLRPESELVAALKDLADKLPEELSLRILYGEIIASEMAPTALTDDPRQPRIGKLTQFRDRILKADPSPGMQAVLGHIFTMRAVLELRRGRTRDFGVEPNTYVLNRLFELAAEFAGPETDAALIELATAETIEELLYRPPAPAGVKNGAVNATALFFIKKSAATEFAPSCARALTQP